MRIKVKAQDLKKGQIAYLPYYGDLRRAKIVFVGRVPLLDRMRVEYVLTDTRELQSQNMCIMDLNSVYEVYKRNSRKVRV